VKKGLAAGLVLVVLAAGCAWLRPWIPPDPDHEDVAVVGISVGTRTWIALWSEQVHTAGFIRLEEGDDPLDGENWVESNYAEGNRLYLLDAEPGDYVAVAVVRQEETEEGRFFTFLDEEIIRSTRVTVRPGEVVYMGDYELKISQDRQGADDAQRHYEVLLYPGYPNDARFYGSCRQCRTDPAAEEQFLEESLELFQNTGWERVFRQRLDRLRGSAERAG
jgi:hypothetical protein